MHDSLPLFDTLHKSSLIGFLIERSDSLTKRPPGGVVFFCFCFFLSNRFLKNRPRKQYVGSIKLSFLFIYCHSIASLTHSIDLEWEEREGWMEGSIAQSQASVVWS